MRLLLLRHGQTSSNVLGLLDTDAPGPSLTALGERQALEVPKALADHGPHAIFVSTVLRTQQTAVPLAEHFQLRGTVLGGVREIEAGALEDRSDPESVRTYLSTAFAWAEGRLDVRVPGGPDGHEFFARYDAAIAEVVAADVPCAVVVSHGMAIRAWAAARAHNIDGDYAATHELDNTGLVILDSDADGRWTLVDWHSEPIMGSQFADEQALDPIKLTLGELPRPEGSAVD
ncbi:MAG: histidine phosphatase family protein [Leifsonia sp.]